MKTKLPLICLLALFLLAFKSKAQNFTFINNKSCPVTIIYEMRYNDQNCNPMPWPGPQCCVCQFGTVIVNPGVPLALRYCKNYTEMNIVIIDIGGGTVPTNLINTFLLCPPGVLPFGQSGMISGGFCGGQTYNANVTIGSTGEVWTLF
jgi:hypothetical protein